MTDTELQEKWQRVNAIMIRADFSWALMRASRIWASRLNTCPKCQAAPHRRCRSMTDINHGIAFEEARINQQPHAERLDYEKLEAALKSRGYE